MITKREDGRIESICCPWNREDVKFSASDMNPPRKLSEDDIDDVLSYIEAKFDASLGISWDTIYYAIDTLGVGKE